MNKALLIGGVAAILLAGALGCEKDGAPTGSKTTAAAAKTAEPNKTAEPAATASAETKPAKAEGDISCKTVLEKISTLMGEKVNWEDAQTKKDLEGCEKDAKQKPEAFQKCAKCNMDANTAKDTMKCEDACKDLPSMSGG